MTWHPLPQIIGARSQYRGRVKQSLLVPAFCTKRQNSHIVKDAKTNIHCGYLRIHRRYGCVYRLDGVYLAGVQPFSKFNKLYKEINRIWKDCGKVNEAVTLQRACPALAELDHCQNPDYSSLQSEYVLGRIRVATMWIKYDIIIIILF